MPADLAGLLAGAFEIPIPEYARAHVGSVARAVAWSAVVAVPAGLIAARMPASARAIRRACSAISAVPALAWLGACAALLASEPATLSFLVLCTAPPLVRGVLDGVGAIDPTLTDVARAIGLAAPARIRLVAIPLALPGIARGVSGAVTYGSAATTVAAIGGAGGLGEPILAGLAAGDPARVLAGAAAATMLTFLLRLLVAVALRLTPPLWGARGFHHLAGGDAAADGSR
jgi:osmoprotectant transport system permease protein